MSRDFNFFNAHKLDFEQLNRRILQRNSPASPSSSPFGAEAATPTGQIKFVATAGNIELAVAGGSAGKADLVCASARGAGCGCDYPAHVCD